MKYHLSRDFIRNEFIGLYVEVLHSKNPNLEKIHGTIIDETKNTFIISTERGNKVVPKNCCIFLFYFKGFWIKIDGKLLCSRPWERIKLKIVKKV